MTATATETTTTEPTWSQKIGAPAYQSIADMVNALECDYDRLEELREARQDYFDGDEFTDEQRADDTGEITEAWARDNEEDSDELATLELEAGDCKDQDEARERIQEDALSVQVRSGWYTPGDHDRDDAPAEFELLLTTGGPAVRIIGELDGNGEPDRAWLEVQDWGKPWTEYYTTGIGETCLAYARCFNFTIE